MVKGNSCGSNLHIETKVVVNPVIWAFWRMSPLQVGFNHANSSSQQKTPLTRTIRPSVGSQINLSFHPFIPEIFINKYNNNNNDNKKMNSD